MKKKTIRYSKIIVTLVIILNIIFTAAFLIAFLKTQLEPVTLIIAWFGFSTGELFMLAFLKHDENKAYTVSLISNSVNIKEKEEDTENEQRDN